MPEVDLFDISDSDTVWDAWLNTVTLLDIVEKSEHIHRYYDFQQARNKIAKIYALAETHAIDNNGRKCSCGLTEGEHGLLKRKMLRFFKLQVANLKHFIY